MPNKGRIPEHIGAFRGGKEFVPVEAEGVGAVDVWRGLEGDALEHVTGTGEHPWDAEIELHAIADDGWVFRGWKSDALYANDNPRTITKCMKRNEYHAVFEESCNSTFALTTEVDGEGCVLVDGLRTNYDCGEEVPIQAVPDLGHVFKRWEGDCIPEGQELVPNLTISMDASNSLTAVFESESVDVDFTVSVDIDNDGEPEPYTEGREYLWNVPAQFYWSASTGALPSFGDLTQAELVNRAQEIALDFGSIALTGGESIVIEQNGDVQLSFYRDVNWTAITGPLHPQGLPARFARPPVGEQIDLLSLFDGRLFVVAYNALLSSTDEASTTATFKLLRNGQTLASVSVPFLVVREELGGETFFESVEDYMGEKVQDFYRHRITLAGGVGPIGEPLELTYDIVFMRHDRVALRPIDAGYGPVRGLGSIHSVARSFPTAFSVINGTWQDGRSPAGYGFYKISLGPINIDGSLARVSSFEGTQTGEYGFISQGLNGEFDLGNGTPKLYSNGQEYDLAQFRFYSEDTGLWDGYDYSLTDVASGDTSDYNAVYGLRDWFGNGDYSPIGFVGLVESRDELPIEFKYVVSGASRAHIASDLYFPVEDAHVELATKFFNSGIADPSKALKRVDPQGSIGFAVKSSAQGGLHVVSASRRHSASAWIPVWSRALSGWVNNYIGFFPVQEEN